MAKIQRFVSSLQVYLIATFFGAIPLLISNAFSLPFEVGEPFPDLTLPTLEGNPLSIRAFRGKKTVLHIWASW